MLAIARGGAGEVTLERLRLTGASGNNGIGSGIRNDGRTLTMTGCTVSGNTVATGGQGGGIANDVGTLTLRDCRIADNHSALHGGGIFAGGGSTRLTGATQVHGNTADLLGGGIYIFGGGNVTIEAGCQVTANEAPEGAGGGIYNDPSHAGTVMLEIDQIVTGNIGGNCAGEHIDNCNG